MQALKSLIKLKRTSSGGTLSWKLRKGLATAVGDFGDPVTGSTRFTFCLYDATGLQMAATTPAGALCGARPCWKPRSTRGFSMTNSLGDPDGLTKVQLVSGPDGSAKVTVAGKGAPLSTPVLPLAESVRAQLVGTNGQCWETTIARVTRNDATQFLGRGQ